MTGRSGLRARHAMLRHDEAKDTIRALSIRISIDRHHLGNRVVEHGAQERPVIPAGRGIGKISEIVLAVIGVDRRGEAGRFPEQAGNREISVANIPWRGRIRYSNSRMAAGHRKPCRCAWAQIPSTKPDKPAVPKPIAPARCCGQTPPVCAADLADVKMALQLPRHFLERDPSQTRADQTGEARPRSETGCSALFL